MYKFYILYSEKLDRYYIGSTGDEIGERLRRHNSNHRGFTGRANDWIIMYTESFDTKALAGHREREVKKWKSRKLLEKLIKGEI
ncbi:GIY-YIG nuclease family protein [Proteiniphilum sp.]|uniref:GIY-YIG nuclease family protein n=1 Tax=Proteiniphilum sp. TaxID=1926877 RepID=UPI003A0FCB8E